MAISAADEAWENEAAAMPAKRPRIVRFVMGPLRWETCAQYECTGASHPANLLVPDRDFDACCALATVEREEPSRGWSIEPVSTQAADLECLDFESGILW
jgi:hypothetical protein